MAYGESARYHITFPVKIHFEQPGKIDFLKFFIQDAGIVGYRIFSLKGIKDLVPKTSAR